MNKKKRFVGVGLAVLSSVILAACSSTASNTKVYSYVYSNDPDSLDYVVANRATTSDVTGNLIDGLLENDKYGNLIPSLAEDWTVSKDGLTYTYKLRKDAKWYTSDGEEYAEVKAQDFVTGLKHAADGKSEALRLPFKVVGVVTEEAGEEEVLQGVLRVAPHPFAGRELAEAIAEGAATLQRGARLLDG